MTLTPSTAMIRVLTILFAVLLTGAWPSAGHALSLDEIMEKGVIRIGVYRDFPPFSYRDAGGELVGIDVDIGREIATRMGVAVTYMELTADENVDDDLRNGVWKGHYLGGGVADVMLHMPVDRELNIRNDLVVLFGAYYRDSFLVARDPVKTDGVETLPVFAYEKVAVELDSLPDLYLSGAFGGRLLPGIVRFATPMEAVDALVRGEVAGVMAPASQLEAGLRDHRDRFDIDAMPTPGLMKASWDVGVAVKHTYRALGYAVGDVIDAMEGDGTMERLFSAHGVTWRAPEH